MKNNTNELNKAITGYISAVDTGLSVGYLRVPRSTALPYAVFEHKILSEEDGRAHRKLEINIFASSDSSVETLADEVEEAFDHLDHLTSDVSFETYKEQRLRIDPEETLTKRIRLTFDMFTYAID